VTPTSDVPCRTASTTRSAFDSARWLEGSRRARRLASPRRLAAPGSRVHSPRLRAGAAVRAREGANQENLSIRNAFRRAAEPVGQCPRVDARGAVFKKSSAPWLRAPVRSHRSLSRIDVTASRVELAPPWRRLAALRFGARDASGPTFCNPRIFNDRAPADETASGVLSKALKIRTRQGANHKQSLAPPVDEPLHGVPPASASGAHGVHERLSPVLAHAVPRLWCSCRRQPRAAPRFPDGTALAFDRDRFSRWPT
jgi:hypothetical protein